MRIDGAWRLCDDGIVRPVLRGAVRGADGSWIAAPFLVDPGADRTVLCAHLLEALNLRVAGRSSSLAGIGGQTASVVVDTQIRLFRENGTPVLFNGQFAGITDPEALDMSVLGRDISNLFALIIDRPQDVVCLLGQGHTYTVTLR